MDRRDGGDVERRPVSVLLIGKREMGFSSLHRWLEGRECRCTFVSSHSEGARLFAEDRFDLVLCSDRIGGISALLNSAVASPTSAFCCHTVEDGYWWLPVIRDGKKCLGEPGLRPSEFAGVLARIVEEVKSRAGRRVYHRLKSREDLLVRESSRGPKEHKRVRIEIRHF